MTIFQQTPSSQLDYTINWASRGLGTDTIASSSWSVSPSGLSAASSSYTTTTTTVWLTGGTSATFYTVTNTIVTAGSREMQYSFIVNCVAQIFT